MTTTGIGFVVDVPPGSIGITITKLQGAASGPRVSSVLQTSPVASLLSVGDILLDVDGTPLQRDADMTAWMSVITKNSNQTRKLFILCPPPTQTAIEAPPQPQQQLMQPDAAMDQYGRAPSAPVPGPS
jgi:PDZ domain